MQEVKILNQAHQKKENKQSIQPQKKALNFGIHFLCKSSTAQVLLTFRAHCRTQLFIEPLHDEEHALLNPVGASNAVNYIMILFDFMVPSPRKVYA